MSLPQPVYFIYLVVVQTEKYNNYKNVLWTLYATVPTRGRLVPSKSSMRARPWDKPQTTSKLFSVKKNGHTDTLSYIKSNKTSRLLLVYRSYVCRPVISLFWDEPFPQSFSSLVEVFKNETLVAVETLQSAPLYGCSYHWFYLKTSLEDIKIAATPQANSAWKEGTLQTKLKQNR